jgi:hypothetical protein
MNTSTFSDEYPYDHFDQDENVDIFTKESKFRDVELPRVSISTKRSSMSGVPTNPMTTESLAETRGTLGITRSSMSTKPRASIANFDAYDAAPIKESVSNTPSSSHRYSSPGRMSTAKKPKAFQVEDDSEVQVKYRTT